MSEDDKEIKDMTTREIAIELVNRFRDNKARLDTLEQSLEYKTEGMGTYMDNKLNAQWKDFENIKAVVRELIKLVIDDVHYLLSELCNNTSKTTYNPELLDFANKGVDLLSSLSQKDRLDSEPKEVGALDIYLQGAKDEAERVKEAAEPKKEAEPSYKDNRRLYGKFHEQKDVPTPHDTLRMEGFRVGYKLAQKESKEKVVARLNELLTKSKHSFLLDLSRD